MLRKIVRFAGMESKILRTAINPCFLVAGVMARFFSHKHKWQIRGRNRYGGETYRICLKCRKTYQRVNDSWEDEIWQECEPIPYLDSQFDTNDKFIFI